MIGANAVAAAVERRHPGAELVEVDAQFAYLAEPGVRGLQRVAFARLGDGRIALTEPEAMRLRPRAAPAGRRVAGAPSDAAWRRAVPAITRALRGPATGQPGAGAEDFVPCPASPWDAPKAAAGPADEDFVAIPVSKWGAPKAAAGPSKWDKPAAPRPAAALPHDDDDDFVALPPSPWS